MPTPRLILAATTTAVAGLVHLAAGPAHSQYPLWYAGGLVAVGLIQLTAAAGLLARRPAAAAGTVAVHVVALGTWAVSRTVGLPSVGAHSVGAADAIVAVLQVTALVAIIVARLAARSPSGEGRPPAPRLVATVPVALLSLVLGGFAMVELQAHEHDDSHAHPAGGHEVGPVENPTVDHHADGHEVGLVKGRAVDDHADDHAVGFVDEETADGHDDANLHEEPDEHADGGHDHADDHADDHEHAHE